MLISFLRCRDNVRNPYIKPPFPSHRNRYGEFAVHAVRKPGARGVPHVRLHGRSRVRRPPHDVPHLRPGRQGPDPRGVRGCEADGPGGPGAAQPDHHLRPREFCFFGGEQGSRCLRSRGGEGSLPRLNRLFAKIDRLHDAGGGGGYAVEVADIAGYDASTERSSRNFNLFEADSGDHSNCSVRITLVRRVRPRVSCYGNSRFPRIILGSPSLFFSVLNI